MAPQQNSTLIDENLGDSRPSLLNLPEEISRCSPILPLNNRENLDKNNNADSLNKRTTYKRNQDVNFILKWELTEKQERHCYKNNNYRSGSYRSSQSHRSRSISLYGVNGTVQKGHTEITIFLDDEPRYVSGVTNKTTCNDIIKALIDDEINNGNYKYYQQHTDGTASRDYSDYVITECWRGIERSYDGNMAILPVWKAWSRVQNEIRLNLKHHKDIQDPLQTLKTNTTLSTIRDYIFKLLRFGKGKKRKSKPKQPMQLKNIEEENQPVSNDIKLFLNDEKKFIKNKLRETYLKSEAGKPKTPNDTEIQVKAKANREKLYKLSETRTSVRKRRAASRRKSKKSPRGGRRESSTHCEPNNFLRKRKDACIRSSVRNKLAQKNVEMNQLFDREYALTKELSNKCKMYKFQNELYTTSDKNFEMSVGQIQQSIEACAKEIIQTEHELLKVKNEIKEDISIINNLKRLAIDTDLNECGVPIKLENILKPQPDTQPTNQAVTNQPAGNAEEMLFVDNIYEFCDNNASVLV